MLPFLIFLGLSAGIAALAVGTSQSSDSGSNLVGSSVQNLLGLSASGDTQYEDSKRTNVEEAEKDRLFQREMADLQYQRSLPSTQMQNYRDAGLNPSLMYGQMSDLQTSVPAGAEANAPSPSSGRLDQLLGLGPNTAESLARVELARSQARLNQEKAETEGSLRQARLDNLISATEANRASVQDAISKIEQRVHQNTLTDAQISNISFEQMYKSNALSIDYRRLQNETQMTDAQIDNLKADKELKLAKARVTNREYDEMIWTYAVRAAGLEAKLHLTEAQIEVANKTAAKLGLEGRRLQQVINLDSPKENYMTGSPSETGNPISFEVRYSIGETIKALLGRL